MDTGVLERIRNFEADVERSVDSVVQQELFRSDIENSRHRILLDHFKLQQSEQIRKVADKLLDLYLDDDDIVAVQETAAEGQDAVVAAIKQFEARIADIREYHHTYRDLPPIRSELVLPDPKILGTLFSAREQYGECFDMEPYYNLYSAFMTTTSAIATDCCGDEDLTAGQLAPDVIKYGRAWPLRMEYFRFIPWIPEVVLHDVHAYRKVIGFQLYRSFVMELLEYLLGFYKRVYPLQQDLTRLLEETEGNFDAFWDALMEVKNTLVAVPVSETGKASRLNGTGAEEEVEEGGEAEDADDTAITTKAPAITHGQKQSCGLIVPPPMRRFHKTFSLWPLGYVEAVVTRHGTSSSTDGDATVKYLPRDMAEVREVCVAEAKIAALLQSLLFDTLQATEQSALCDYSRTAEEVEATRARAERDFQRSVEHVGRHLGSTVEGTVAKAAQFRTQVELKPDEEAQKAAAQEAAALEPPPAQLLGDDDQPIARWLVQLQQLDKSFLCEVCGGTVYKGPKVFREHFGSERHAEGLRRLGVVSQLKDFEGVTSIRMVIQLRDRYHSTSTSLLKRLREERDNEETQDVQGKVVTSKDYMRFQQRRT